MSKSSLLYKKAWKIIEDFNNNDNENISTDSIQIEYKNKYEIPNIQDEKLITSQLESIYNSKEKNTSAIIYNLLENTSIDDNNNTEYSDINNNTIKILLYLVKNKFVIEKEDKLQNIPKFSNKINKNGTNPFFVLLNNLSPEDIIENLFGISNNENKHLLKNIITDEISLEKKTIIGLSHYNFRNEIVQNLAKYTYDYFSYQYINPSNRLISNNFLLGIKIFEKIIDNKIINISDIFPFANEYPLIETKINNLFKFDIFNNIMSFDFNNNINTDIFVYFNKISNSGSSSAPSSSPSSGSSGSSSPSSGSSTSRSSSGGAKYYNDSCLKTGGANTNYFNYNQLFLNNNKLPSKYNESQINLYFQELNVSNKTLTIKTKNISSKDDFEKHMKILYNIISDNDIVKSLMNNKSYTSNKIIALEKILCIFYSLFENIKTKIDKFISDIVISIRVSTIENSNSIINLLYDLKRIYDFKSIFGKNIEFIETSSDDYNKVIFDKKKGDKKKKESKYIRINDFYNKCISNKGLFFNLINIIKEMNLFRKPNDLTTEYIKFTDKSIEKDTSSTGELINLKDLRKALSKYSYQFINSDDVDILNKKIIYKPLLFNSYGLINILNLISNKNKSYYFGLNIIKNPIQVKTNIENVLNNHLKLYKKHKIQFKKIVLKLLNYFENGVTYEQYNFLLNSVKSTSTSNYSSINIYNILLRNLAENINLHYKKDILKSYKLLYYYIILNIHNQIKLLITLMKKMEKKEDIIKCRKLRKKYLSRFKDIFGKDNKYKTFYRTSDETSVLSKMSNNKNILLNVESDNKCSIFGKSLKIKSKKEITELLKSDLKKLNPNIKIDIQINIIKGLFENIFESIDDKKLYIPIILTNLSTHILPNKYKYLNLEGFYKYLINDRIYDESNASLFFKKLLISIESFDTDILEEEISELDSEKIYIIVSEKNSMRNKSRMWRKMNLYVFMYHHIYIKNMSIKKSKLYALRQLLVYLYDSSIYNKYTSNIWAPFTGMDIKKLYKQINSSKKSVYDNNVTSYECLTSYLHDINIY